ncbi:hypothetical protein AJ87_19675 [Rhizobium yanglingense]|nr:hypothetical protein AJ87_19675 [Rhizobium yanglingense]
MSNIIAFPINHPGDVAKLGEFNTLAQARMEDVRDQIQDIAKWLIAIQDELAKVTMNSAGLSETANTNPPAEHGWA